MANDALLRFYHFTKIGGIGDVMTARYADDNTEVHEIVNWYKREIAAQSVKTLEGWPWQYGRFSNGETIGKQARVLYRERPDLAAMFDDPFSAEGDCYYAWLERACPELLAPASIRCASLPPGASAAAGSAIAG